MQQRRCLSLRVRCLTRRCALRLLDCHVSCPVTARKCTDTGTERPLRLARADEHASLTWELWRSSAAPKFPVHGAYDCVNSREIRTSPLARDEIPRRSRDIRCIA
jgi:hypothetical protein